MTRKKGRRGPDDILYICPICPRKEKREYDTWKSFSAHWLMKHPNFVKPEREEMEKMMKEGYTAFTPTPIEEPPPPQPPPPEDPDRPHPPPAEQQDSQPVQTTPTVQPAANTGSPPPPPAEQAYGQNIPRINYKAITDDPVHRLAFILDAHGVHITIRNQILTLVQMHPHFLANPMNLQPVLQSMLDRKFHSRIQLMINSMVNPPEPEPDPFLSMMVPPFGAGGQQTPGMGYPYPQQYQQPGPYQQPHQQFYYPPPFGGQSPPAPTPSEPPMDKTLQTLATLLKTMQEFSGGGKHPEEASELKQDVRDMRAAVDRVVDEARKEREEMRDNHRREMDELKEANQKQVETLNQTIHSQEVGQLQQQIDGLRQARTEDMSESLGSLIRDAGAGMAAEMHDVREAVTDGMNKVVDHVTRIAPGSSGQQPASQATPQEGKGEAPVSIADATKLMETEMEIEGIAQQIESEELARSADLAETGVEIESAE